MRTTGGLVSFASLFAFLGCAPSAQAPSAGFAAFPAGCPYRADFQGLNVLTSAPPAPMGGTSWRAASGTDVAGLMADCMCRQDRDSTAEEIERGIQHVLSLRSYIAGSTTFQITEATRGMTDLGHHRAAASGTVAPTTSSTSPQYIMRSVWIMTPRCIQSFMAIDTPGAPALGSTFIRSIRTTAPAPAASPVESRAAGNSAEARLAELERLRSRTLISPQEYSEARRRILSGL